MLIVDEIENRLHPLLVQYIIEKFQNQSDGQRAQLIFTYAQYRYMNRGMLRRGINIIFVDKRQYDRRVGTVFISRFFSAPGRKYSKSIIFLESMEQYHI